MIRRCLVTVFVSLLIGLSLSATLGSSASFIWSYKTSNINSLDVESNYIATSTVESVYILDTRGKLLLKKHVTDVNSVTAAANAGYFLVSARDGLYYYDMNGKLLLKNIRLIYRSVASSDEKYAVGEDRDRPVARYFDNSGTEICKYETGVVNGVSISGDGEHFVVGTGKGAHFLTSDCSVVWKYAGAEETTAISLSKDGNFVAVGSTKSVHVFDRSGNTIWKYETDNRVKGVSISAKGSFTAAIVNVEQSVSDLASGKIVLFDKDGKIVWSYDRPYMTSISMSPDGRYVAIGTSLGIEAFENTAAIEFTSPPPTPQITTSPPPSTTSPPTTPPPVLTVQTPKEVTREESTAPQIATVADLESKVKTRISSTEKLAIDLTELVIVGKRIGADVSTAEQKISNAILLLKEANGSYVMAEEKYKEGDIILALNHGNEAYLKGSSGMSMLDDAKAPLYSAIKQRLTDAQLSTESAVSMGRTFRLEQISEEKLNLAKDEIRKTDDAFWSGRMGEAKTHILNADALLDYAKKRIYYLLTGLFFLSVVFITSLFALKRRIKVTYKQGAEGSVSVHESEPDKTERLTDPSGVISISALSKRYKNTTILKNISFQINPGVLCAIVGPSGSGKSTLVEIIAGRITPTRGNVNIFGKDQKLHKMDINKLIGFVPQHPELSLEQTAWDNMMNSAIKWQVKNGESRSERILKQLNIHDKKDVQVKSLSGGQLKRLSLAMELVREPPVLILDEPTTGLDPPNRDEIITALSKLAYNDKKTVIFSTHFMDEADHSDEVVLVGNAQILAQGSPNELVKRMPGAGKIVDIVLEDMPEDLASKISNVENTVKIIRKGRRLKVIMGNPDAVEISQKLKQLGGVVAKAEITKAGMDEVFVYFTGVYPEEH